MKVRPDNLPRSWAAALIALAALFHVQWVAACDAMPRADARACCMDSGAGGHGHCDHESKARSCLSPFAKTASLAKLSERVTDSDDAPDHPPIVPYSAVPGPAARLSSTGPPRIALAVPDGRRLYLTSSRLRL